MFPIEYDNVIQDDCEPFKIEENHYLGNVFTILKEKLSNFDEYTFIVHNNDSSELPNTTELSWIGEKRVLIWISAEHNFIPEERLLGKYHHIFAQYHWDTDNITSIPLGYYAKSCPKIVPMQERLIDMSFIGCFNNNRLSFSNLFSKIPSWLIIMASYFKQSKMLDLMNHMAQFLHPKNYIKFTSDFGTGFDQSTYLNLMHSSKISLCPRGFINVESFRIYESMRAGCVTITEKLPDRSYYKNIPAIQVNNWKEGLQIAADLLKDQSGLLSRIGEASRKFYEDNLSPEATAKIIMDKLAEKAI